MKTYKIDGVILQTTNFGDANRIATIFTRDFGKLELNAYGCRKVRSPMAGAIQPFNHISAEVSRGGDFDVIREAEVIKFCGALTADLERAGFASVFFEAVNRMTVPKMPEAGVYELLVKSLPILCEGDARLASLAGLTQFMEFSGMQLSYFACVNCGVVLEGDAAISLKAGGGICRDCMSGVAGELLAYPAELRRAFEKILAFDWLADLKIAPRQVDAAERISWRYAQFVLGRELNAVKFLLSLK